MTGTADRQANVGGHQFGLPYSKGLMASRIMATGLAPARAFHVAEIVERRLHALGEPGLNGTALTDVVLDVLRETVGEPYTTSFAKWQLVAKLDRPLVVLVGGATGVGKSTIATMLANRLGITRVIPTDAIREVMRAIFSREIMPTIHTSSFDAARLLRHPLPRSADPVLIGFGEQASAVAVGVEALISRAIMEGTDLILEGAHLVPGFLERSPFEGKAVVVPLVVTVDDEEMHRSHFLVRAREVRHRPAQQYLDYFENIRKQQEYVKALAAEHGVPVVPSTHLDDTLTQVIDLVFSQALEAVPKDAGHVPAPTKRGT